MKKFLFLIALMIPAFAFGMSKSQERVKVTGVVEWYGTAPFTWLGLKTEDGTLYSLTADKDKKDALEELHGYRLCVEGILLDEAASPKMMSAPQIKVKGWKKI